MARTIHLNDSFFGRDAGTIDDDGTIKLPDGIWGSRTVGYLERDGIYVPDGWSRRKVIDISPLGHMYLMEDAGLLSRGTWVGSITPAGEVRDTDRVTVAELRKGLGSGSDAVDAIFETGEGDENEGETGPGTGTGTTIGPGPEPGVGTVLLKICAVILVPIAMWVIVSSTPALLTSESVTAGGKLGVAVTLLLTAIAVAIVSLGSGQGVLATLLECVSAGTVVAILSFGAYVLIADAPTELGDWLLLLLFGPFVCFCWAAATTIVVGLPISAIRAIARE